MRRCILIYNFSPSEEREWQLAIKQVPEMELRRVDKSEQAMLIGDLLLDNKFSKSTGPVSVTGFDGKMILMDGVEDNILEYILAASKMITGDKVYKAVITEVNATWNSDKLYHHLIDEDEEMRRLNPQD